MLHILAIQFLIGNIKRTLRVGRKPVLTVRNRKAVPTVSVQTIESHYTSMEYF